MPRPSESQLEFVLAWFTARPNKSIRHKVSKKALEDSYKAQYRLRFEDSDRAIRTLAERGKLIKEANGVYRYDPDHASGRVDLRNFSETTRLAILKRDGYRCVVCGFGEAEGRQIHVDHVIPREKGGEGSMSNGQTLCASHNYRKKVLNQRDFGYKLFSDWQRRLSADESPDPERLRLLAFCNEVLRLYAQHDIDQEPANR